MMVISFYKTVSQLVGGLERDFLLANFNKNIHLQVLLVNPVCFFLYGIVSFAFFNERIVVEEYTLISFFGSQYRDYQRQVGTGIPGIQGYHGPLMWGEARQN